MVGFSVSWIVTVKLHVFVLPTASVTLKVLVVVPTGNEAPDPRPAICVNVDPEQLSPKLGFENETTLEQVPAVFG